MLLISALIVVLLVQGVFKEDAEYGQGLRAVVDRLSEDREPQTTENDNGSEPKQTSPQTEFDYYEVLPDIEQVMPDDLPDGAVRARPLGEANYFLQIASFKNRADAEELRARLALQGIIADTQAREVEGKGLFYRVRTGPYDNPRNSRDTRATLEALGFEPLLVRTDKAG